jgi:hypothetical protein
MPVSKGSRLVRSAKQTLDRLAGPAVDYISHLEKFWLLSERVKDHDFVGIQVRRVEIEMGYVRAFQRIFERLSVSGAVARDAVNKVEFFIDGYDEDPRELYEIPEVVAWLDAATAAVKNLIFFLRKDEDAQGLRLICLCRARAEVVDAGRARLTNPLALKDFMNEQFRGLKEFTEKRSLEDLNKEVSLRFSAFIRSLLASAEG